MGLVTRYFSTAAAGSGDGTSWADRAALFVSGYWNSIITSFDFTSNSLECLVGPGTYVFSSASSFSPTIPATSQLLLWSCDSAGSKLPPPNSGWTCDQPAFSTTGYPILQFTSNTIALTNGVFHGFKIESSGVTNRIAFGATCYWCDVTFSSSNSASHVSGSFSNCVLRSTAAALTTIWGSGATSVLAASNVRFECVGTPTGSANAIQSNGTSNFVFQLFTDIAIIGFPGFAVDDLSTTTTSRLISIDRAVITGCGGGIRFSGTTGQTSRKIVRNCIITGNGGYGIDGQSGSNVEVVNCRLRDNTGGNVSGLGNHSDTYSNVMTAGSDADEYNDAANGDYRIKATAAFANRGIGVSQMPAAGSGPIIIIEGDD